MQNRLICLLSAIATMTAESTQSSQHHNHEHPIAAQVAQDKLIIHISISPEARVSASKSNQLPVEISCDVHDLAHVELPVLITNRALISSIIRTNLVDSEHPAVNVEFSSEPLKGIPEEDRVLKLVVSEREATDVTISFRADNDLPDLGGRDRIHLFIRCKR